MENLIKANNLVLVYESSGLNAIELNKIKFILKKYIPNDLLILKLDKHDKSYETNRHFLKEITGTSDEVIFSKSVSILIILFF
jgi:hypothetical protein